METASAYTSVGVGRQDRVTRSDSPVENVSDATVTITDVALAGESVGLSLHRAVLVSGSRQLTFHGRGWPPRDRAVFVDRRAPTLYAERAEPAIGAEIEPGDTAQLTLLLSFDRSSGSGRFGGIQGYTVTYEVEGETFEQTATTGYWVCAPQCPGTEVLEREIEVSPYLESSDAG